MDVSSASLPVEIGITDESHAARSIVVIVISPVSSPVEVVHLGGVQDAATCGISDGSLNLSEEFNTLVGESVTLASSKAAS
jgi:hypothetical protein